MALGGLIIWAQSAGLPPIPSTPNTGSITSLATRRWFASLSLSPSTTSPSLDGLMWFLAGLGVLFVLSMLLQGPVKALGQLFDLPGHARLLRAAIARLRRSSRVVAVAIGATVLVWTADQMLSYGEQRGRDDMLLLTKSRTMTELAVEHGVLAALTPMRDVYSLGDNLPLLILASVLIFQAATQSAANPYILARSEKATLSGWATVCWGIGALYALYRLAGIVAGQKDGPLGGCLFVEAGIVPILMAPADGLLLSFILVELRNASLGDTGNETIDPDGVVQLFPGAVLACLLAMPARYLAAGAWLLLDHIKTATWLKPLASVLTWQLGQGFLVWQALGLVFAGLAGAVAWTRGTWGGALSGYLRMLRLEGGHLTATLAGAVLAVGGLVGLSYGMVLSLPVQTWVLSAADAYAHYVSLPIGLLTLAAFVELGERALPAADLASEPIPQTESPA